jgi:hypothetical protein
MTSLRILMVWKLFQDTPVWDVDVFGLTGLVVNKLIAQYPVLSVRKTKLYKS